ncbi:MAG: class I SAM-dependent methyltransferase [Candidatus Kerfeldbacteria bacterium]|nr:class I SAM-dependent methyltransferase [Candidatus Kerfeldbacteria bacterium]
MSSTGLWLFIAVQIFFVLVTVGFLAFIGYVLWSFRKEVPYVPTPRHVVRRMVEDVPFAPHARVLDLGSGHGRIVRAVARRHPVSVTGIEDSPVLIFISRLLTALDRLRGPYAGTVAYTRANFHDVPLQDVQVVLCFLTDEVMASLAAKFTAELPIGATLVSYLFPLVASDAFRIASVTQVGKRPRQKLYVYTKVA